MLYKQLVITLLLLNNLLAQNFILQDDDVLSEKANTQIELIGKEFYQKTSIPIYLLAIKTLDGKKITTYQEDYSKKLQKPFVLLTFAKVDKKVDMLISLNKAIKLDKEYVLDDIIIPILVTKSKKNSETSKYSAALLSGYSEIAEEIAKSKNITLENAIGNDSKNFIYWFRVLIYTSMIAVLILFLYKRNKAKKE